MLLPLLVTQAFQKCCRGEAGRAGERVKAGREGSSPGGPPTPYGSRDPLLVQDENQPWESMLLAASGEGMEAGGSPPGVWSLGATRTSCPALSVQEGKLRPREVEDVSQAPQT